MKQSTRNAIGTFIRMKNGSMNGWGFSSWRTPDNKHFYLAPSDVNLNVVVFGRNPDKYEVSYILLGTMDMIK